MSTLTLPRTEPRLAPIERSGNLLVRLLALVFRWKLGKVMTPLKVIYARMPRLVLPQMMMVSLGQSGLSLDDALIALIQTRVSMLNGCTFCTDLHQAMAEREGHGRDKLAALAELDGHDAATHADPYSPSERAALRFADEVSRTGRASDATFEALRSGFDERQIVELTWLCAFTTYLNRLAVPLGIGSDGFCALVPQKLK